MSDFTNHRFSTPEMPESNQIELLCSKLDSLTLRMLLIFAGPSQYLCISEGLALRSSNLPCMSHLKHKDLQFVNSERRIVQSLMLTHECDEFLGLGLQSVKPYMIYEYQFASSEVCMDFAGLRGRYVTPCLPSRPRPVPVMLLHYHSCP